jgi:hypothetical protein
VGELEECREEGESVGEWRSLGEARQGREGREGFHMN